MSVFQKFVGLLLALSSSIFIGTSFIIKKKGLRRASTFGVRAGSGGYSYLWEPLWWAGLLTMVIGEAANFAAYAFAPAILVTPLGALSILVTAVLAHVLLQERLNVFGIVGCILCVTGTLSIILHAPEETPISSVVEVSMLAQQPGFMLYTTLALCAIYALIWRVPKDVQTSNILVYIAICSIVGSLSVMSCKAVGIALKLTFEGSNQLVYPQTYIFLMVVVVSVVTQMNYLNKALDLFNTAIVTPIYYVMFTTLTVAASMIMFRERQEAIAIISELSGFVTIVCGTFLLHATKDIEIQFGSLFGSSAAIVRSASMHDEDSEDGVEMSPAHQAVADRTSAIGLRKLVRQDDANIAANGVAALR